MPNNNPIEATQHHFSQHTLVFLDISELSAVIQNLLIDQGYTAYPNFTFVKVLDHGANFLDMEKFDQLCTDHLTGEVGYMSFIVDSKDGSDASVVLFSGGVVDQAATLMDFAEKSLKGRISISNIEHIRLRDQDRTCFDVWVDKEDKDNGYMAASLMLNKSLNNAQAILNNLRFVRTTDGIKVVPKISSINLSS